MIVDVFLSIVLYFFHLLINGLPTAVLPDFIVSSLSTFMYSYNTVEFVFPVSAIFLLIPFYFLIFFSLGFFKAVRFIIQSIRG